MTLVSSEKSSWQSEIQRMLVEGGESQLSGNYPLQLQRKSRRDKGVLRGEPKASSIGTHGLSSLDVLFILSLIVSAKSNQISWKKSSSLALHKYHCFLKSGSEESKKILTVKMSC